MPNTSKLNKAIHTFFASLNVGKEASNYLFGKKKIIGEVLFSISVGGLMSSYFLGRFHSFLSVLSRQLALLVYSNTRPDVSFELFNAFVVLLSLLLLLVSPLLLSKRSGIKISILLVSVALLALLTIIVIARNEISVFYQVVAWLSSAYIIWLCLGIFRTLSAWVTKKSDEQVDLVKLTLIWTIIAFILGKIL